MRCIAIAVIVLVANVASADDDWGVKRDPFDAAVVARYRQTLARDPHDGFALRALVGLYARYRTVGKLEAAYRATRDWASLVVLARLPRADRTETTALWQAALQLKPDDGRAWLAYGELVADRVVARDAFVAAVQFAKTPEQKRVALKKLIGTNVADDEAYAELIAISAKPERGKLWFERGAAQLAGDRYAPAAASFTSAARLSSDPELRLTATLQLGIALERQGSFDEAFGQYVKALDRSPPGYYLREELVSHIIAVERQRGESAVALFENRWPIGSRGYFEWTSLGHAYRLEDADDKAIAAYRRAAAIAPAETSTQRTLIAMLDKLHPNYGLVQHERAARAAPGDADLQIELAERYRSRQPARAMTTLANLAIRMRDRASVRQRISKVYSAWGEHAAAAREYQAVFDLEPDDNHALGLGHAYWAAGQRQRALEAWTYLEQADTARGHYRHGEVLSMYEAFAEASAAYTKSLAKDATSIDAWVARSRAYLALGQRENAIADAFQAVVLKGQAGWNQGRRERLALVLALGPRGARAVQRWEQSFRNGSASAGYLLATHYNHAASPHYHEVITALYERVPADAALGMAVVESFRARNDFAGARRMLIVVEQRTPSVHAMAVKLRAVLDAEERAFNWEQGWQRWKS